MAAKFIRSPFINYYFLYVIEEPDPGNLGEDLTELDLIVDLWEVGLVLCWIYPD